MPRDASSTTRVVYTCSLKNFRFNEDFEVLHPAEMIDTFKVWRDVIKYMLPICQVRKKIEAAEEKFPASSARLMDQIVMAMDNCAKANVLGIRSRIQLIVNTDAGPVLRPARVTMHS